MSDQEGLGFCCYCLADSSDEELEPHPFAEYATGELVCQSCFKLLFELGPSDTLEVSDNHFTFRIEKTDMSDIRTVSSLQEVRDFYDDLRYNQKNVGKWTFGYEHSRYHHDQLEDAEKDVLQSYWEEEADRFDPEETKVKPTNRWVEAETKRLNREEDEIKKKRAKLATYKRRKMN